MNSQSPNSARPSSFNSIESLRQKIVTFGDHKFSMKSYQETRKLKKYLVPSKGFHPIVDGFESHSCKIKQGN